MPIKVPEWRWYHRSWVWNRTRTRGRRAPLKRLEHPNATVLTNGRTRAPPLGTDSFLEHKKKLYQFFEYFAPILYNLWKNWWTTVRPHRNGHRHRIWGSKRAPKCLQVHRTDRHHHARYSRIYDNNIHISLWSKQKRVRRKPETYRISMWTLPLRCGTKVNCVTSAQTWKALASSLSTSELFNPLGYFVMAYVNRFTRQRLPALTNIPHPIHLWFDEISTVVYHIPV